MGNLLFFISLFYLFKKSYRALCKASGIRHQASGFKLQAPAIFCACLNASKKLRSSQRPVPAISKAVP